MNRGLQWLLSQHGPDKAAEVAAAYRRGLDPAVTDDLRRFCRADQSSHTPGDPYTTAFYEGARAVWLHMAELVDLSPADIETLRLYQQGDNHG